jgi:hypothetical protein
VPPPSIKSPGGSRGCDSPLSTARALSRSSDHQRLTEWSAADAAATIPQPSARRRPDSGLIRLRRQRSDSEELHNADTKVLAARSPCDSQTGRSGHSGHHRKRARRPRMLAPPVLPARGSVKPFGHSVLWEATPPGQASRFVCPHVGTTTRRGPESVAAQSGPLFAPGGAGEYPLHEV